jgi:glycosyltransferase involved in cell wall biosynthesis
VPEQLIVPVEDVEALAERMQWAVSHLDEWRELMQASWQKAQQQLTLDAMVQKTQTIYTSINV